MASKKVGAGAGKRKATNKNDHRATNSVRASTAAPSHEPEAAAAPRPPEAAPAPYQLSPEEFGETLAVLAASINSPFAAHSALVAYNMGLQIFIQGTNPGYPYPEMSQILRALQRALGDISRHGHDDGARHAKGLLQAMVKSIWRYEKQRKPTHRELVLGAIRSSGYALTSDGCRVRIPSYTFLAKAILHNRRSLADFEQQVSALTERLAEHFGPDGIDPKSDPDEVARQAFKIAGIKPHNALDAAQRMKMLRKRRKGRA